MLTAIFNIWFVDGSGSIYQDVIVKTNLFIENKAFIFIKTKKASDKVKLKMLNLGFHKF